VVVSGRDRARGEAVAARITEAGGSAAVELCDVRDLDSIREFAERVERTHGPVDILVNSAGIFIGDEAATAAPEDLQSMWEVNVSGLMVSCQEFGRRMIERGHGKIINLASISGLRAQRECASYCATKGAVVQLTRVLALEWISKGVNVNCVAPSDFETPMTADYIDDPEYKEHLARVVPAGRPGRTDELDGAVLYLASPASDMVVGHTLVVDGGTVITGG
jgi:NAD(P)-dependent dehydrogenase (short-subunit alcohol dehydrogenase family)